MGCLGFGLHTVGCIATGQMKVLFVLVSVAWLWGDEWLAKVKGVASETWKGVFMYWWQTW